MIRDEKWLKLSFEFMFEVSLRQNCAYMCLRQIYELLCYVSCLRHDFVEIKLLVKNPWFEFSIKIHDLGDKFRSRCRE